MSGAASERVVAGLLGVSKWYGAVIGVNEVTIDLGSGITGLLGPNGAGKSTLMKLITGQLRPSLGEVRVLGVPVWSTPSVRGHIGFSPEVDAFHEEMTALEFVWLMGRLSGLPRREARRRAEASLDRTGMLGDAGKALRACSKGMRQRVKIAQAIAHDPRLIVLDEPLAGIDPAGRIEMMALLRDLREGGKAIVVSTHILHEVEGLADGVILMARGRVLAAGALGRIRELLAEYPLTVRVVARRRRSLAAALLGLDCVVGVSVSEVPIAVHPDGGAGGNAGHDGSALPDREGEVGDVIVKVRRPDDFFRRLPEIALSLRCDVTRIEPLDASAEAVFRYLIGGSEDTA